MKNNQLPKEELLDKLSEIYDQLEELEKAIDTNLSEHRKKMINDQTAKMMDCNRLLIKLESDCLRRFPLIDQPRKSEILHPTNIKLKLGF